MPPAKKPSPIITVSADGLREMMAAIVADAVDTQLADIKTALSESKESLYEIKTALTGNGLGANHGLIERMAKVEGSIEALQAEVHKAISDAAAQVEKVAQAQEARWSRLKWTSVGIGIGSGVSGAGVALTVVRMLGA